MFNRYVLHIIFSYDLNFFIIYDMYNTCGQHSKRERVLLSQAPHTKQRPKLGKKTVLQWHRDIFDQTKIGKAGSLRSYTE